LEGDCIRLSRGAVVSEWEMCGLWHEPVKVYVTTRSQQNGEKYRTFLNSKEEMLRTANMVRKRYLERRGA